MHRNLLKGFSQSKNFMLVIEIAKKGDTSWCTILGKAVGEGDNWLSRQIGGQQLSALKGWGDDNIVFLDQVMKFFNQ